jgi:hypothetical protein
VQIVEVIAMSTSAVEDDHTALIEHHGCVIAA